MKDLPTIAAAWQAAGLRVAEAILVSVQHSSPRRPGARMLCNERGETAGAVSMGCVESDLREHLLQLLQNPAAEDKLVHYGVDAGGVIEIGLSCGGEIDVWCHRLAPDAQAAQALASRAPDQTGILLTPLIPGAPQTYIASPDEFSADAQSSQTLAERFRRGQTGILTQADGSRLFAEILLPQPRLIIVGTSPIATALCESAAKLNYRVFIVDPREQFAHPDLFPGAEAVLHEWPDEAAEHLQLAAADYIAIVAHDPKLDHPALLAALQANCRYIGLLGSSSTRNARYAALRETGIPEAAIEKIHGPIGLNIGAIEPAEIALSILAEITLARRGPKTRSKA